MSETADLLRTLITMDDPDLNTRVNNAIAYIGVTKRKADFAEHLMAMKSVQVTFQQSIFPKDKPERCVLDTGRTIYDGYGDTRVEAFYEARNEWLEEDKKAH